MFTGLVQGLGEVCGVASEGAGVRLTIREAAIAGRTSAGDSVAINGCCLTAVAVEDADMAFEAGPETLQRTNLGRLQKGDQVNLEASLRMSDALGGHLVTGHIDGLGTVDLRHDDGADARVGPLVRPEIDRVERSTDRSALVAD